MSGSVLRKYELSEEEGFYEYPNDDTDNHDRFEDMCGREYEKELLLSSVFENDFNELLYITNFSFYLASAPKGYGKAYLAMCYAQTLKENGYHVHRINFAEIMKDEGNDALLKTLFNELIERTDPDGESSEKIYIYFENFKLIFEEEKYETIVLEALKKISDLDCKCIIYTTTEDITIISTNFLTMMDIMELDLPDESARREFFEKFLRVNVINPSNDEEVKEIYPINISAQETESEHKELDILSIYCAKETEGLSFGQLEKIRIILMKVLKTKLMRLTNGMCDDALWSHVTMGKMYCIDEEGFEEIVYKVRKSGETMRYTENASGVSSVNASQPQIVYAMPPGMPGGMMNYGSMMGYGDMMQGNGAFVAQQKAREKMLEDAAGDNPEVATLNAAFSMAEEAIDSFFE